MNVAKAITRGMQAQKRIDEQKLVYWRAAWTMERLARVCARIEAHEAEARRMGWTDFPKRVDFEPKHL